MKTFPITLLTACLSGCTASTPAPTGGQTTEVVAVVRSYGEFAPLETRQPEPNFFRIELEIVSPGVLSRALIDAKSETPLKEDNPLRKVGGTLSLAIRNLEQHRGTSSTGDGRNGHILYAINLSDIRKATVKDAPPESIPLRGTAP